MSGATRAHGLTAGLVDSLVVSLVASLVDSLVDILVDGMVQGGFTKCQKKVRKWLKKAKNDQNRRFWTRNGLKSPKMTCFNPKTT